MPQGGVLMKTNGCMSMYAEKKPKARAADHRCHKGEIAESVDSPVIKDYSTEISHPKEEGCRERRAGEEVIHVKTRGHAVKE